MAEETLVEWHVETGEKLLRALPAHNFDVAAAAWVHVESGWWYLYLASKIVDEVGTADGYKVLHGALRQMSDIDIDPFDIKLIGTQGPLAKEIADLYQRYPTAIQTLYRRHKLGSTVLGEARIYPPLTPTT